MLVSCFQCNGAGCPMCRHSGWIEIGGSGMVDPNVLRFVGYDPEEVSGFAFGWGLERMAILRHGLPDIRDLWAGNPYYDRGSRLLAALQGHALERADAVVTVTEGCRSVLAGLHPGLSERLHVLPNGFADF